MSNKTGKTADETQTGATGTGSAGGSASQTGAGATGGDQTQTGAGADNTTATGEKKTDGDKTQTGSTDTATTDAGAGSTGSSTETTDAKSADYATADNPVNLKAMLEGTELTPPKDPKGKPTGAKKSYIAVFGGPMVNPYTDDTFTGEASKPVRLDSWIQTQIDAGKIQEAPAEDDDE